MKKRVLIFLTGIILAALAAGAFFWEDIAVYVAPKAVLTRALTETAQSLKQRLEPSPVSLLAEFYDPDSRYQAKLELKTENAYVGPVSCRMDVRTDGRSGRLQGTGVVSTNGNDLDLDVYLDRDFMALSSQDLLGGAYYGIRYASFPKDIRRIPLISMFVSDAILKQWEAGVEDVRRAMQTDFSLPDIPEISEADVKKLMAAVLLLPSDVETVTVGEGAQAVQAHRITYRAEGDQVRELMGYLLDQEDPGNALVTASFYLHENQLIWMHFQGTAGGNSLRLALELMENEDQAVTLRLGREKNGEQTGFSIRHSAAQEDGFLRESWKLYDTFEGLGTPRELRFRWEPVMGELMLEGEQNVRLNIARTSAGLTLLTDHFEQLWPLLSGGQAAANAKAVSGSMSLERGGELSVPQYKNLSEWSLDDLLVLLGGVGSLIGFPIT